MTLTWERLDHLMEVDPILGEIRWKNPNCNRAKWLRGKLAGCFKHIRGYVNIYIDGRLYKRHRLIWFYVHKSWPTLHLDHADGDVRNDAIANLRNATRSQNMYNTKLQINNKSGVKGVFWDRRRNKWRARIRVDCQEINLGRFDTKEAAIEARLRAEVIHHGEFARAA